MNFSFPLYIDNSKKYLFAFSVILVSTVLHYTETFSRCLLVAWKCQCNEKNGMYFQRKNTRWFFQVKKELLYSFIHEDSAE